MKKICFKCNQEKDLSEFYKHNKMGDGHLGKCKLCTIADSKKTTEIKTSTPEGLEKERERGREKYKRLNYAEKAKIKDEKTPWRYTSTYKSLHKVFKIPKGLEIHHWNYNDEYLKDIIVLKTKQHKIAHTFMKLDLDKRIFKRLDGTYLETKEEHIEYLIEKGILF